MKTLWLFTQNFPYGKGEAFLENELPYLAAAFEQVRILPMHHIGGQRPVPQNVQVTELFGPQEVYRPLPPAAMLANSRRFLHVFRLGRRSAPGKSVFRQYRREFISELRQAMHREQLLQQRLAKAYDPHQVRLYSFWTGEWATVLGLWKLRDPRVRFVSRMMGFDMYDHRAPGGWPRFQHFHVQQVDHVFVIAQAGLDHIRARFPQHEHKFSLSYLATRDHGAGPWLPSPVLRIASCSNLVELKRVPLIAKAMEHVTGPVQWTHFGDGPERKAVVQMAATLPASVQVNLMGSRPNGEVIDWYKQNPVDVFVHASRTEGGAPVALQEAASFGIPLVAADAGGVREIVTGETGVLLPNDLSAETLGQVLTRFRQSPWYTMQAREKVRAFWAARFEAGPVYGELLRGLIGD